MTGHTHAFGIVETAMIAGIITDISRCACGLVKAEQESATRLKWPGQDWLRIDPLMLRVVCAPPVSRGNVEKV